MRHGSGCDEDSEVCTAVQPYSTSQALAFCTPLLLTFLVVGAVAALRVFPRLSRIQGYRDGDYHALPVSAPPPLQPTRSDFGAKSPWRKLAAASFAIAMGLSAVLAELILAEVLGSASTNVRDSALRLTVQTLLFLLIIVIPFLEVRSSLAARGWSFQRTANGRIPRTAWMLQLAVLGSWWLLFWSVGLVVPAGGGYRLGDRGLAGACLDRLGIFGICSMALLSGFASVSSPWHALLDRRAHQRRPVTEADVRRKQTGLDATAELMVAKRHRLQLLRSGAAAVPQSAGLLGRLFSIGTGGDAAEIEALQMEIAGLDAMAVGMTASLSRLRRRLAVSKPTPLGRLSRFSGQAFGVYCVYRILATSLATVRRFYYPHNAFSQSDPINRLLGLLAKHWDPEIDTVGAARLLSFLMSGVILAASANSVVQTFHLFARWMPGLLQQARTNLALFVGQISATYVVSAALLLRSSLPVEIGSSVGDALENALDPPFVDRLFDTWFLLASLATLASLYVSRKIAGTDELLDEMDDLGQAEMGQKRS